MNADESRKFGKNMESNMKKSLSKIDGAKVYTLKNGPHDLIFEKNGSTYFIQFKSTRDVERYLKSSPSNESCFYSKISDDGSALTVRIPARIRDKYGIDDKHRMKFEIIDGDTTNIKISIIKPEEYNQIETYLHALKELEDKTKKKILQSLYDAYTSDPNRWLSTYEIKKDTELNWNTVNEHLKKLLHNKQVQRRFSGKSRNYKREGKNIKSQSQIEWKLNLLKE